jgi:predicted Ser/Thr protein kinase
MVVDAHVGSVLADRYELVRHIARGGMGDVYEGLDRVLDRRVAVKVFRATMPADRSRFDAEVRVLASLNHPGLVPVYDAGSAGEDAFVVLELIDGPPLRTRMDEGPLPAEDVREIAMGLAEALAYIHGRGVVHRDVTPSNVLCQDGRCRLVDFGIARLLDAPRMTSPQLAIGTAAYMAPEQVKGEDVTGAADVYSLGLVLLEALTGAKAFPGPAAETSIARLARDPDTVTSVPPAWQPILAAMTARDPMARPTAAQVAARLVTLPADASADAGGRTAALAPVAALAPHRRDRQRRADRHRARGPLWAIGATAAAVVAVLVLSAGGGGGSSGDPADAATTSSTSAATAAVGGTGGGRAALRGTSTTAAPMEAAGASDPDAAAVDDAAATPTSAPRPLTLPSMPPRSTSTTAAPTTTAPPASTTTAPTTTAPPPSTTTPAAPTG